MTTAKRPWKESRRNGTVIIANKTINGCQNPYVGNLLGEYRSEASDELDTEAFFAEAYLIEEYGDEAIEAVADMSKEEREAYVGAIEDRLADDGDGEPDPRTALDDLMEN